jgi:hypothetical protein
VYIISVFSSLHPIREKTNYWHKIPHWVASRTKLGGQGFKAGSD